ncbi:CvpA family protein [Wolbachia endosymbiont of Pentidionis agamae]|uniref:CvpA family protein n=1 Tax=Wolbachia endosymbiont of Pentidionis agamae TaxID=3110435 RepID=UPI002FD3297B
MMDIITTFILIFCVVISIMRGFIKEICALILLFLSVIITVNYYDFFTPNYSQYFSSGIKINVLSTVSVFIVINLLFMLVNNLIMQLLLPVRFGIIDRVSGSLVGLFRGILFSYVLFFMLQLYYYTVFEGEVLEHSPEVHEVLPNWIIDSYSYQFLFSAIDNFVNQQILDTKVGLLIDKIKQGE